MTNNQVLKIAEDTLLDVIKKTETADEVAAVLSIMSVLLSLEQLKTRNDSKGYGI